MSTGKKTEQTILHHCIFVSLLKSFKRNQAKFPILFSPLKEQNITHIEIEPIKTITRRILQQIVKCPKNEGGKLVKVFIGCQEEVYEQVDWGVVLESERVCDKIFVLAKKLRESVEGVYYWGPTDGKLKTETTRYLSGIGGKENEVKELQKSEKVVKKEGKKQIEEVVKNEEKKKVEDIKKKEEKKDSEKAVKKEENSGVVKKQQNSQTKNYMYQPKVEQPVQVKPQIDKNQLNSLSTQQNPTFIQPKRPQQLIPQTVDISFTLQPPTKPLFSSKTNALLKQSLIKCQSDYLKIMQQPKNNKKLGQAQPKQQHQQQASQSQQQWKTLTSKNLADAIDLTAKVEKQANQQKEANGINIWPQCFKKIREQKEKEQAKHNYEKMQIVWFDAQDNDPSAQDQLKRICAERVSIQYQQHLSSDFLVKLQQNLRTKYILIFNNKTFYQFLKASIYPISNSYKYFVYCRNMQFAQKNVEESKVPKELVQIYNTARQFTEAVSKYIDQNQPKLKLQTTQLQVIEGGQEI